MRGCWHYAEGDITNTRQMIEEQAYDCELGGFIWDVLQDQDRDTMSDLIDRIFESENADAIKEMILDRFITAIDGIEGVEPKAGEDWCKAVWVDKEWDFNNGEDE